MRDADKTKTLIFSVVVLSACMFPTLVVCWLRFLLLRSSCTARSLFPPPDDTFFLVCAVPRFSPPLSRSPAHYLNHTLLLGGTSGLVSRETRDAVNFLLRMMRMGSIFGFFFQPSVLIWFFFFTLLRRAPGSRSFAEKKRRQLFSIAGRLLTRRENTEHLLFSIFFP